MPVRIVTDSACDISLAVAARGLEANTGINDNFNAEEEE